MYSFISVSNLALSVHRPTSHPHLGLDAGRQWKPCRRMHHSYQSGVTASLYLRSKHHKEGQSTAKEPRTAASNQCFAGPSSLQRDASRPWQTPPKPMLHGQETLASTMAD